MRTACLTLIALAAVAGPAAAGDAQTDKVKSRARAAAALALAGSCDCPRGEDPKCGKVGEVLAKVGRDMAEEARRPATAPMPREKALPKGKAGKCDCGTGKCDACGPDCECPRPSGPVADEAKVVPGKMPAERPVPQLPAAFTDANGCRWEPAQAADGRVYWTRICPRQQR